MLVVGVPQAGAAVLLVGWDDELHVCRLKRHLNITSPPINRYTCLSRERLTEAVGGDSQGLIPGRYGGILRSLVKIAACSSLFDLS